MTVDIAIEGCARHRPARTGRLRGRAPKLRVVPSAESFVTMGVGLFIVRLLLAAVYLWQAAGTAVSLVRRRAPRVGPKTSRPARRVGAVPPQQVT